MNIVSARERRPGRAVLNPGGPGAGIFTFINYMKQSAIYLADGAFAYPPFLNANGYPQSSMPSRIQYIVNTPADYVGNWVLEWDGSFGSAGYGVAIQAAFGDWDYETPNAFVVSADSSNGIRLKGSDGYIEFTPPAGSQQITISFEANKDYSAVTRVALYRKDQETLFQRGEIFNPEYVAYERALNPIALRFLGWDDANFNNRNKFAHTRSEDHVTYVGDSFNPSLWAGTASYNSGTNTYTLDLDGFTLQDRAAVHFWVGAGDTNDSSAPLLVVEGSAAKTITTRYWETMGASVVSESSLATCIYDATIGKWSYYPGGFTGAYEVPISVQAKFCNKLRRGGWFLAPTNFDAASFTSWCTEIKNYLDPTITAYIEYSNEVLLDGATWPKGYQFATANAIGWPSYSFTNAYFAWALKVRQLFGAARAVFGARPHKNVAAFLVFLNSDYVLNYFLRSCFLTLDSDGMFTTGPAGTATGAVSGSTLTITGSPTQPIRCGMTVAGTGITGSATVRYFGTGKGGAGTYSLDANQPGSAGPNTYTFTAAGTGNAVATDYALSEADGGDGRVCDVADMTGYAIYWRGPNMCNPFSPEQGPSGSLAAGLQTSQSITGITNANPGKVQKNSHGYNNGDRIYIENSGMTTLNGAWTTVANKTANDFELSDTVNSSGVDMSSDTTSAGTFASGTMQRVVPGINDDLITAADDYDSATPSRVTAAMEWMSNEQRQGTRLNVDGVTTYLGAATTLAQYQGGSNEGLNYWTHTSSNILTPLGLEFIAYEGCFEGGYINAVPIRKLGYAASYAQKINALNYGWRASTYARDELIYQYELFASVEGFTYPAASQDAFTYTNYNPMTGSISGTTLTVATIMSATLQPGMNITAVGVSPGTTIVRQLTGNPGDTGTYEVSISHSATGTLSFQLWNTLIWSLSIAPMSTTSPYANNLGSHEGFRRFSNDGY